MWYALTISHWSTFSRNLTLVGANSDGLLSLLTSYLAYPLSTPAARTILYQMLSPVCLRRHLPWPLHFSSRRLAAPHPMPPLTFPMPSPPFRCLHLPRHGWRTSSPLRSAILLWGVSVLLPAAATLTLPCSFFLPGNFFSSAVSQSFLRIQCPLCCRRCITTVVTSDKPGP